MNARPPTPSLLYPLPSLVERVALDAVFARPQPLEVELGCGDGTFLVEYARRHPERNFLGIERLLGRIRKVDRKGRRAGLDNLRLIRIEASYFLRYLLPAGSVAALHVYFPDPWPKRRHWERRLINRSFADDAWTALAPGGVIYLRTDDPAYFAQMQEVLGADPRFAPRETPLDLSALLTDFERDFQARGIQTLRAAYAKLPDPKRSPATGPQPG